MDKENENKNEDIKTTLDEVKEVGKEDKKAKNIKEDSTVSSAVGTFLNVMSVILLFSGGIGLLVAFDDGSENEVGLIILVTSLILAALLMGLSELIDVNLKILLELRKQNNNDKE